MAANPTRLTHKIAIKLHLVAESLLFAVLAPGGQSGNFWIHPGIHVWRLMRYMCSISMVVWNILTTWRLCRWWYDVIRGSLSRRGRVIVSLLYYFPVCCAVFSVVFPNHCVDSLFFPLTLIQSPQISKLVKCVQCLVANLTGREENTRKT